MRRKVMVVGTFDGIHNGHIHYLKEARKLGNHLTVLISKDKTKWRLPPLYKLPEKERANLVKALNLADKIILGSKKNPLEKILKHAPHIVAITKYHPVEHTLLESELRKNGSKTKVKLVKHYKKSVYDKHHKKNKNNLKSHF